MAPGRQSMTRFPQSLSQQPLPIIIEDVIDPPAIPAKSPRRLTMPSLASIPAIPQNSTSQSSQESVPGRRLNALKSGLKAQEWIARRGGWYRLVLGWMVTFGLIVGLAVGLTLGLRER
jgi:hypothetical protein